MSQLVVFAMQTRALKLRSPTLIKSQDLLHMSIVLPGVGEAETGSSLGLWISGLADSQSS